LIVSNHIYNNIVNDQLKVVFKQHIHNDEWNVIGQLNGVSNIHSSPSFDRCTFSSIFGRSFALTYRYKDCLNKYNEAEDILEQIPLNNIADRALKAFHQHNLAIALGYMGKVKDKRFLTYLSEAGSIYEDLGADEEKLDLSIHKLDVEMYNSPLGYLNYSYLADKFSELKSNANSNELIELRIGVLCLLNYLRSNHIKDLELGHQSFKKAINGSDQTHYKNYWARCGLVVSSHLLQENCDRTLLNNPPEGSITKAKRFPPVLFLLIRSHRILGKGKKAWNWLRKFEESLKLMLEQFPEDEDYRIFIIRSYNYLVEERLQAAYENTEFSDEQKLRYMIHANEILQNRLLTEDRLQYLPGQNGSKNVGKMMEELSSSDKDAGLVYITCQVRNIGNKAVYYFLVKPDLKKNKCLIQEIKSVDEENIRSSFTTEFILNKKSTKSKQDSVLEGLANLVNLEKFDESFNSLFVIPNSIFLDVPLHMCKIGLNYLFETCEVTYWPSLKLAASVVNETGVKNPPKVCVFYTTEEKLSIQEAKEIHKISPKSVLIPDPSEKDFTENSVNANIIHVIAHHKNGKIHFSDIAYHADDILGYLAAKKLLVIMHVCGSRIRNTWEHPIAHESITHYLLGKGHESVITYNWDLAQEASIEFSKHFYSSLTHGDNLSSAFRKSLIRLKDFRPVKYGGYMLWGNDFLKFTDRLRAGREVI
tara:strand:- start:277 stop:2388 length:2112 start_codon:yes stop_codon:yes gene_type:complete